MTLGLVFGTLACSAETLKTDQGRTSTTIAPAGGQVAHPSGGTVIVPAGALAQPTQITVETVATPDAPELASRFVGRALLLGPEGQTFLKPVTVVVPYDATTLPAGTTPRQIRIYTAPRGSNAFVGLDTTVDETTGTVRANVSHFSVFVATLEPKVLDRADAGVTAVTPALLDARRPADVAEPSNLPNDAAAPGTRADASTPGPLALGPQEIATRLAQFLWKVTPDTTLMTQAATRTKTPADVRLLATEMLKDPRARALPADFVVWWLHLDRLAKVVLDTKFFPTLTPALRDAMLTETRTFASAVTFDGVSRFDTLLTAPYSHINKTLANLYGVSANGNTFEQVALNPAERAGLLTQASVLVMGTVLGSTSPTLRGTLVLENILCKPVPPPPPGIDLTPPPRSATLTRREQYSALVSNPACAACHTLVDPIGFGFENFDASGAFRTTENGKTIDTAGNLSGGSSIDGPFLGAIALAKKLAASKEARACFAQKWLEYALNRKLRDQDMPSTDQIVGSGDSSNWDILNIIAQTTATPAFLAP